MGEKRKKVSALSGSVTLESVKVIAESVGVSELSDAALMYIAEEMTFRLRHTVQVCVGKARCYCGGKYRVVTSLFGLVCG